MNTVQTKSAKQIAHEQRNADSKAAAAVRRQQLQNDRNYAVAIVAAAALEATVVRQLEHVAANQRANLTAKAALADRIEANRQRNAETHYAAVAARAMRIEMNRQWNAEEHYAAVAMRAMKAQVSRPSNLPVAANDDMPLQAAA